MLQNLNHRNAIYSNQFLCNITFLAISDCARRWMLEWTGRWVITCGNTTLKQFQETTAAAQPRCRRDGAYE